MDICWTTLKHSDVKIFEFDFVGLFFWKEAGKPDGLGCDISLCSCLPLMLPVSACLVSDAHWLWCLVCPHYACAHEFHKVVNLCHTQKADRLWYNWKTVKVSGNPQPTESVLDDIVLVYYQGKIGIQWDVESRRYLLLPCWRSSRRG